ncbi:MAG: glycine betaine ABC transporter substrate-binding protein [Gammaproteobacteria bacterium]
MSEQLSLLPEYLTAHLELTLFALLLGIWISIPLGVAASRLPWLERLALGAAAMVQTIPSLALLALMVPIFAALGLESIGFLPAFVALVLYSTLPILRNTVTAMAGLPEALREAARGVGMNSREQLLHVELPLAVPVIVAGVRTAIVWTVGAATLATPVGATSLGNYIFSGLQTRNVSAVVVGCVASAVLALVLDGLARLLLTGAERRRRPLVMAALVGFTALYLYAGVSLAKRTLGKSEDVVVIGAKTFTEQYILSEVLAARVRQSTGLNAEVRQSLGSSVVFDALKTGTIDLCVDYTGTIWTTVIKRQARPRSRATLLKDVERYLATKHGIHVVAALGFENTYALAMRRARADKLGVRKISDLAQAAPDLSVGGDYEFFGRPEWKAIREVYRLEVSEQRSMDPSLMYGAVARGAVDLISAFSTDGRIVAFDLVVLEDDRHAIPPYDAIVLASEKLSREHEDLLERVAELNGRIDNDQMRRMNLAVDRGERTPQEVARDFLQDLSRSPRSPRSTGP